MIDPQRDCLGLLKAKELEEDIRDVKQDVGELRRQNAATHDRIFADLGELKTHDVQQDGKLDIIVEKMGSMADSMREVKADAKEVKNALPGLAHKVESMDDLTDDVRVLKEKAHKLEQMDILSKDVDELKGKPAKRWESMVGQLLALAGALIFGMVVARLGLG